MIGWYIGLIGIVVGIAGGIYFMRAIMNMGGDLKSSIFYLVAASFIYVIFSSIMVVLGLIQYDIEGVWWEIVPILFALSSIIFVYGSYKLVSLLSGIKKR